MTNPPQIQFDADTHTYTLNGRPVPSVTQINDATLGSGFQADDYYLKRGSANHACYALIAQGQEFDCDLESAGFVKGCRLFFNEAQPQVLAVEKRVYSVRHQFAGTLDLLAVMPGMKMPVILDWKGSLNNRLPFQLAGYAIALEEMAGIKTAGGIGIQITGDGLYQTSHLFDLKQERREFPSLRVTWGIKQRMG